MTHCLVLGAGFPAVALLRRENWHQSYVDAAVATASMEGDKGWKRALMMVGASSAMEGHARRGFAMRVDRP